MSERFAENLAHLRAKKGLTQRDLGAAAGVAWSMISKYESGKSKPRLKVLMRLAEALDVDVDDLQDGESEPNPKLRIHEGFSSRLVRARSDAQIGKKTLSERSGIEVDVLRDFELGVLLPLPEDVFDLAKALNIDPEQLAGTHDEEETLWVRLREEGEPKGATEEIMPIDPESYRTFIATAESLKCTPGELISALALRELEQLKNPEVDLAPIANFIETVRSKRY